MRLTLATLAVAVTSAEAKMFSLSFRLGEGTLQAVEFTRDEDPQIVARKFCGTLHTCSSNQTTPTCCSEYAHQICAGDFLLAASDCELVRRSIQDTQFNIISNDSPDDISIDLEVKGERVHFLKPSGQDLAPAIRGFCENHHPLFLTMEACISKMLAFVKESVPASESAEDEITLKFTLGDGGTRLLSFKATDPADAVSAPFCLQHELSQVDCETVTTQISKAQASSGTCTDPAEESMSTTPDSVIDQGTTADSASASAVASSNAPDSAAAMSDKAEPGIMSFSLQKQSEQEVVINMPPSHAHSNEEPITIPTIDIAPGIYCIWHIYI